MIRLAITMRIQRVSYPSGSVEERDALSSDWYAFLSKALPNALFLPLPNIGSRVTSFLSDLHITGILCSGGDEWGKYPRRDDTEKAALTWAKTHAIPVLGICRGAQVLQIFCGGSLSPIPNHVNVSHTVCNRKGSCLEVNSFHALGIRACDLSPHLRPEFLTEDGLWVESFRHTTLPWVGLLWHPERKTKSTLHDQMLLQEIFSRKDPFN